MNENKLKRFVLYNKKNIIDTQGVDLKLWTVGMFYAIEKCVFMGDFESHLDEPYCYFYDDGGERDYLFVKNIMGSYDTLEELIKKNETLFVTKLVRDEKDKDGI